MRYTIITQNDKDDIVAVGQGANLSEAVDNLTDAKTAYIMQEVLKALEEEV